MILCDHAHVSKKRGDKDMCAIKKKEREKDIKRASVVTGA